MSLKEKEYSVGLRLSRERAFLKKDVKEAVNDFDKLFTYDYLDGVCKLGKWTKEYLALLEKYDLERDLSKYDISTIIEKVFGDWEE